jgi:hypothetical protein
VFRRLELLDGAPRRQGQRGVIAKPYRLQEVRYHTSASLSFG